MTENERLAKNERIKEQSKQTKQKRKSQVCRVYRVKIDISHLNEQQKTRLKMLFVEAKWLYNDTLTFMNDPDINDYDSKTLTVHGLDKDRQPVTHELQYISSQMRQSVIQGLKDSLKALATLREHKRKIGSLRYKSDYVSINLKQHRITYRFYDECHIGIQGFKERIRIKGANQFWNIPDIEFANANLLSLPDGYYLVITTYQNKGGEKRKYKSEIGIDMGIKTTITTSDGEKYKVLIGESERIKKCQRLIARRKKGSNNCAGAPVPGSDKARKLLQKAYQKLTSRKKDTANKIVHKLLEHEHVYMQDKNLSGWHKGMFGRTVQHSVLGLVKAKLMNNERVTVLSSREPTTKYCPVCGKLKKDITLADRVYECSCGYREDRDIHAARNMILLAKKNTCGTQGIHAFGEDVRQHESQDLCCSLVELGSSSLYRRSSSHD
ncbi:MAG: transposase [Synergistaceae bacterium]|nr:transposase [Synergistaceae bacterium]